MTRLKLAIDHMHNMHRVLEHPKNAAKGHWRGESIDSLLDHLDREVDEFKAAIWGLQHGEPRQRVIDEGADVSNIVAMIVDNISNSGVRNEDKKLGEVPAFQG